jgi:hypothetical protein
MRQDQAKWEAAVPRAFLRITRAIICCGLFSSPVFANGWWCPPGSTDETNKNPECVFDVPNREVKAHREQWFAESRVIADKLSVPYEDLVIAYLTANNRGKTQRYCLRVFGDKPDDALTRRLKAAKESPRFCYGPQVLNVYIHRITQESADRFKVIGGSYCGPLCAAEGITMITRNADGTFVVGKGELLWISDSLTRLRELHSSGGLAWRNAESS